MRGSELRHIYNRTRPNGSAIGRVALIRRPHAFVLSRFEQCETNLDIDSPDLDVTLEFASISELEVYLHSELGIEIENFWRSKGIRTFR
jgi:hypothetical protein